MLHFCYCYRVNFTRQHPFLPMAFCLPQDLLLRKCQGEADAMAPATLPLPPYSNKLFSKKKQKQKIK